MSSRAASIATLVVFALVIGFLHLRPLLAWRSGSAPRSRRSPTRIGSDPKR